MWRTNCSHSHVRRTSTTHPGVPSPEPGFGGSRLTIQALTRSSAEIRQFLPAIPSGLLQTADYARATLTPIIAGRPARDVDRAMAARLESQRTLDDRSRRFFFLLTEDAVRRHRADLTVMTGQLRHMAKVAARPNVKMAIIPREAQIDASPLNIFVNIRRPSRRHRTVLGRDRASRPSRRILPSEYIRALSPVFSILIADSGANQLDSR